MKDVLVAAVAATFMGFFLGVGFWGSRKLTSRVDIQLAKLDPQVRKLVEETLGKQPQVVS